MFIYKVLKSFKMVCPTVVKRQHWMTLRAINSVRASQMWHYNIYVYTASPGWCKSHDKNFKQPTKQYGNWILLEHIENGNWRRLRRNKFDNAVRYDSHCSYYRSKHHILRDSLPETQTIIAGAQQMRTEEHYFVAEALKNSIRGSRTKYSFWVRSPCHKISH